MMTGNGGITIAGGYLSCVIIFLHWLPCDRINLLLFLPADDIDYRSFLQTNWVICSNTDICLRCLTLLVGRQEEHTACKIEWLVGVVICWEQGVDCLHMVQLMPVHPKTASSLASLKSRLVLPFWYWLTKGFLEKRPLNVCSVVQIYEFLALPAWYAYMTFCHRDVLYTDWRFNCTHFKSKLFVLYEYIIQKAEI